MLELSHNQKKKKFSRKGIKPFLTLTQQYTPEEIRGEGRADSAKWPNCEKTLLLPTNERMAEQRGYINKAEMLRGFLK